MLDEGRYQARAVQTALGFTQGGSEQLGVLFRVVGGDADGQEITWFGYFTDKTTERTIESLRHAGWTGNNIAVFADTSGDELAELLPNDVIIVVQHEVGQDGKTRAKVQWVNRLGGGTVAVKNKMPSDLAREFGARLRGVCAAIAAPPRADNAGTWSQPQRAPASAPDVRPASAGQAGGGQGRPVQQRPPTQPQRPPAQQSRPRHAPPPANNGSYDDADYSPPDDDYPF